MYNGTTCLRSSVQTNSGPALSVSCSLFLSPFFSHFPPSLFLSLSFRPFYPRPLSSHTLFPPILHDTILSLPPLSTPRASFSRACSCSRLPILLRHSSSPFSLSTSVARTTVNKPLIGLTPISGALFVVNERPAVTSITRVLQCFFLPPSATTAIGPILPRYLSLPHSQMRFNDDLSPLHLSKVSRYSGGGAARLGLFMTHVDKLCREKCALRALARLAKHTRTSFFYPVSWYLNRA